MTDQDMELLKAKLKERKETTSKEPEEEIAYRMRKKYYVSSKGTTTRNMQEQVKKGSPTKLGLREIGFVCGLIILFLFVSSMYGNDESGRTNRKDNIDWSVYHDDLDHNGWYMTLVEKGVDKYVSGVKWPWGSKSYHFADYDDSKDGCIMCVTEPIAIENVVEKQTMIVIFSTDGEGYTIHSVCVGNTVYEDDGKLKNLGLGY